MTSHPALPTRSDRLIDAVVYDFGGVFMASPFDAMRQLADEKSMAYELLLELLFGGYHTDGDHPWHQAERGELAITDARDQIRDLAAQQGHEVDLFDLFRFLSTKEINEAMVANVRRAREAGARTAVLTNNIVEGKDFWRAMIPLDELFDAVVDSSEVGMRKPNPAVYLHTLELLGGVAPERTAFLDDFLGNVEAAERVGMIGVLVEGAGLPAIDAVDALLAGQSREQWGGNRS